MFCYFLVVNNIKGTRSLIFVPGACVYLLDQLLHVFDCLPSLAFQMCSELYDVGCGLSYFAILVIFQVSVLDRYLHSQYMLFVWVNFNLLSFFYSISPCFIYCSCSVPSASLAFCYWFKFLILPSDSAWVLLHSSQKENTGQIKEENTVSITAIVQKPQDYIEIFWFLNIFPLN